MRIRNRQTISNDIPEHVQIFCKSKILLPVTTGNIQFWNLCKNLCTHMEGQKKTSMSLSLTVCGRGVKQMRVMMMSRAVRFGFIHVLVHGSRWRARERAREYRVQVTCKFICFTTSSRAARWRYGPRVGVSKACWRTRVACETEGRAARGRLLLRCLACANARVAGAATPRSLRRAQGCRRGA